MMPIFAILVVFTFFMGGIFWMVGATKIGKQLIIAALVMFAFVPFINTLLGWLFQGGVVLFCLLVFSKFFWKGLVWGAGRSIRALANEAKARQESRRIRRDPLPPPHTPEQLGDGRSNTSDPSSWLE